MSRNPKDSTPKDAVGGLSDVLLALGDELRRANQKVGEYTYETDSGPEKEPILFLTSATVELAVNVTKNASGGVSVWVLSAEGQGEYQRSAKVTVHVNPDGQLLGVGQ